MVEFGDELIIESYKAPWLIWIQLVVTILIFTLLFLGFTVFTADPSTTTLAGIDSPSSGGAASSRAQPAGSNTITKVEDNMRVQMNVETGGGSNSGGNSSSSSYKGSRLRHPCEYFGLMKLAFLKCLGLESTSHHRDDDQHEKQD